MLLALTVLATYSSEAVGFGIFCPFSNVDNFRPEAYSDVISGVVVDPTDVKVSVKFGNSRSNLVEIYDCLTFLRTRTTTTTPDDGPYDNRAKRVTAFCRTNHFVTAEASEIDDVINRQEGPPIGGAGRNATSLIPQRLSYLKLARPYHLF